MGLESELEEDQSDEGSTKEWSLEVRIRDQVFKQVKEMKYLGVIISSDGG